MSATFTWKSATRRKTSPAGPVLGTVIIGAFDDDAVRGVLELAEHKAPLALLPVAAPR